ncbi:MAG: LysE family transporter [Bacteroidales bacterium]|nr:LysE family transporter [Bacteroidales bacterium]
MLELLLGILCGVVLSLFFSFGPAFFSLIQNSLHYGYRRAVHFAFGVSMSDVLIVGLMLTVLRRVDMFELLHNVVVALVASAVMIVMGVFTFLKKQQATTAEQGRTPMPTDTTNSFTIFGRGFLLNIINPSIWLYWVSVIALISGEFDIPTNQMYIFFGGVLLTTLLLDIAKCRLAASLHNVITPRLQAVFNRVVGAILVGFGVYLLVSMIVYRVDPSVREREQNSTPQSTEVIKRIHNDALQHNKTIEP